MKQTTSHILHGFFFLIFFLVVWDKPKKNNILEGRGEKIWFWSKRNSIFKIQKLYDSKKILLSLCKKVIAPLLSSFTLLFGSQYSPEPDRILKWTLAKFGSLLLWTVLSPPTWQNWGEKEGEKKNMGLILPRPCCTLYIKNICKVLGRPGTESPCLPDSRVISPNPTPKKTQRVPRGERGRAGLFTLYCNSGLFVCLRQLVQVSRHVFYALGWGTHSRHHKRHLS